ncbi:hypothetical protein ZOSMA_252G00270 [Zostera marina]|uniref:Cation-transporting P-type ATPase N-terminal domain-containing protein n=1 Tax=Zostera marina TaxID=29655 RepID=A0A0K9PG38_ZOSMR|nr:hypothetical protein ZOSMA_252G00270 [Zostera marina]
MSQKPAESVGSQRSRYRSFDEEAGGSRENDSDDDDLDDDAFDIPSKNAPVQSLKRWRQTVFVLNAARRFRYTLDLKKEKEQEQLKGRIRTHAQVIRAAILFREAGEKALSGLSEVSQSDHISNYGITSEKLISLTRDHNIAALTSYGGVNGLSNLLKTNLEQGICDDSEILNRRNEFGANTYPQKKGKSFWVLLYEAMQDLTLIILIVAAALSLGLGMKTEVHFSMTLYSWALKKINFMPQFQG